MVSLKTVANCIGFWGKISVLRNFYGYVTGPPRPLSLLQQVNLLRGPYIRLNLIRVGIESFTNNDEAEIDGAVQFTRDTYATVGLGIGSVTRWFITTEEADGFENIGDDGEAVDLTDEWSMPVGGLDVFFVLTYSGPTTGLSAVEGPCSKEDKFEMTGSVVAMDSGSLLGSTLAHEVGHYLGLEHSSNSNNLMFESVPNGGNLTSRQGRIMRAHCLVNLGCPHAFH